jgi:hypothetical protein
MMKKTRIILYSWLLARTYNKNLIIWNFFSWESGKFLVSSCANKNVCWKPGFQNEQSGFRNEQRSWLMVSFHAAAVITTD